MRKFQICGGLLKFYFRISTMKAGKDIGPHLNCLNWSGREGTCTCGQNDITLYLSDTIMNGQNIHPQYFIQYYTPMFNM